MTTPNPIPEITNIPNLNSSISNTTSRPALSWCSKCGQSTEISSESKLCNSKNNSKFRKIFDFEESEVLIKSFNCALVDDILFQGTLYASQNYFCFFSRIANKQKKITVSIHKIVEITKEKTAGIFPNAIAIKTSDNRFLFSSFVHREQAFRCLKEVWAAHKEDKFTSNWNLGFSEDTLPKATPLLDLESETEPIITPITLLSADDDIDDGSQEGDFYDSESFRNLNLLSSSTKVKSYTREPTNHFLPRINGVIRNAYISASREQIQLIVAVFILIILTLYIIIMAWKIHDFQMFMLEKFSLKSTCMSKSNLNNIECPSDDSGCRLYRETLIHQQFKINTVMNDLKETLTQLQAVVELSSQIFKRIHTSSLPSITASDSTTSGET